MAGTIVGGPCFFDPPPGDFGDLLIVNDTSATVAVAECDGEAACRSTGELKTVRRGESTTLGIESCNAGTLGVFHPDARPAFACVTEPTQRPDGSLPPVQLSRAHRCR